MSRLDRGIVLVGFMGAGKTTVGRELAAKLDANFLDLDEMLIERSGRSIADLIDREGETGFRKRESEALLELLSGQPGAVIALGGGAWTISENRAVIVSANWLSVWLDTPFELCWHRIAGSPELRPLAPDKTTARELFEHRREVYGLAELVVSVEQNASPADVVSSIRDSIADETASPR